MELNPEDLIEMGQRMMEDIRDEAVITTIDGLIMAAEANPKKLITLDELRYTRQVLLGEEDKDLESSVRDRQALELFDELYNTI